METVFESQKAEGLVPGTTYIKSEKIIFCFKNENKDSCSII